MIPNPDLFFFSLLEERGDPLPPRNFNTDFNRKLDFIVKDPR